MKSVLILLAIFFILRYLKKKLESGKKDAPPAPEASTPREQAQAPRAKAEEMVLDPVCGSYVPISAAIAATKDGKTVYFCSEECRERF